MSDSALPPPKYTIYQAITAAISLSLRAIEEVRALASRPPVKGEPGRDGLSWDDFTMEYDGERTFTFVFSKGADVRRYPHKVPFMLDRGVYDEKRAEPYERGDVVSWGGSAYIAQAETREKPDTTKAWRLAVKRGRDGKDGTMRNMGPTGPLKLG